jgi:hypothetical protein
MSQDKRRRSNGRTFRPDLLIMDSVGSSAHTGPRPLQRCQNVRPSPEEAIYVGNFAERSR